jgi:hypothetical protein
VENKVKLYAKIHKVMSEIKYLTKNGRIVFGNTNYKVLTEEKVTSIVKEKLVENKLIIIPVKQNVSKEGQLTSIDAEYKIIDIETGESEIIVSSGQGIDTQDKGIGKASTYAFKYLLLRTFIIPSGDDPDNFNPEEVDDKIKEDEKSKTEVKQPEKSKYTDDQKALMKKVKEIFKMKVDSDLNKYVVYWAKINKLTATTFKDITPENLTSFCEFTLKEGNKVNPFN